MRTRSAWLSVAAALALATGSVAAAEPQVLSFSAGEDTHEVPPPELSSLEVGEQGGLTICFSDAQQQALHDFTASHIGDTVTVLIGASEVFFLQVVEPYEDGCIVWPLHPQVAETYRARLTGNAE
ncbi:hypothetical protein [Palleronia sp.]|uniref:hypothetical protein n=1 Tax=Palleronia sp. TaxID=1940284 RepID=UPI0035C7FA3A